MKFKKSKSIKFLIAIACAFCLLLPTAVPTILTAKALTNGTFSNVDSSNNLPSGWKVDGDENSDITQEVITEGEGENQNYVLKLTNNGNNARFGLKSTDVSKLYTNSYYRLQVRAKATSGASLSFGVSGDVEIEYYISTPSTEWTTYTLYILTNNDSNADAYVTVYQGSIFDSEKTSTGTVYFDDVTLESTNRANYEFNKGNANTYVHDRNIESQPTTNGSFSSVSNWEVKTAEEIEEGNQIAINESYSFKITAETNWSTTVLRLTNKSTNEDKVLTITSKNEIKLNQFGTYRISFFAKTPKTEEGNDATSSFKVKIVLSDGAVIEQNGISLSSSATNSTYNDFTEYAFFIQAGYNKNVTAKIIITLEKESDIYLDNFNVQRVLYSTYTSGSYRASAMPTSTGNGISNGFFMLTNDASNRNPQKPFTAQGWTIFGNTNKNATMGIISTKDVANDCLTFGDFNLADTNATNPGSFNIGEVAAKQVTTAYVISSAEDTYAGISSSTIEIKSSSYPYARISFYAKSQNGAKLNASLFSGSQEIARLSNLEPTSDQWECINFYIIPTNTMSLTLKISLGTEEEKSKGTLYIEAATCVSISKEVYEAHKNTPDAYSAFVDQSGFFAHSAIKTDGLFAPIDFSINKTDNQGIAGIIDLSNIDSALTDLDAQAFSNLKNNDGEQKGEFLALYLKNAGTINAVHTKGITNNATGYVKISVRAKLVNTTGNVQITLGELGTFTLNKDIQANENGWIECTMIVKTGSNSIGKFSTKISLGTDTESASGLVLMDEITTETVDQETYQKATENKTATQITADLSTKKSNNSKSGLKNNPTAIFFIVLSSILLVAIILLALIARSVKRLPKRVSVNVPQANYDRKHTGKKTNNKNDKGFV